MTVEDSLSAIAVALEPVEEAAQTLRWFDERPWQVATHLRVEDGLPVVDLHDLNARTARLAVSAIVEAAPDLDVGAVLFVVGVGRRSAGPPVLGRVVLEVLAASPFTAKHGARGRIALILDPTRASGVALGGGGLGMMLWWAFVVGCILVVMLRGCAPQ
jgi:hypothetical protein